MTNKARQSLEQSISLYDATVNVEIECADEAARVFLDNLQKVKGNKGQALKEIEGLILRLKSITHRCEVFANCKSTLEHALRKLGK